MVSKPLVRPCFCGGTLGGGRLTSHYQGGKVGELLLMVQESGDHQLRLVVYPVICSVFYIPGGCLGFLPSTVCSTENLQDPIQSRQMILPPTCRDLPQTVVKSQGIPPKCPKNSGFRKYSKHSSLPRYNGRMVKRSLNSILSC